MAVSSVGDGGRKGVRETGRGAPVFWDDELYLILGNPLINK
jgi:hypothetical protein